MTEEWRPKELGPADPPEVWRKLGFDEQHRQVTDRYQYLLQLNTGFLFAVTEPGADDRASIRVVFGTAIRAASQASE
jgi:hypothetical protein